MQFLKVLLARRFTEKTNSDPLTLHLESEVLSHLCLQSGLSSFFFPLGAINKIQERELPLKLDQK